jgi:transposase
MTSDSTNAAGIDTGKHKLDVALSCGSAVLQTTNDGVGHEALCAFLRRHDIQLVGIEASGGYERSVVAHLRSHGFAVAVLQPLQVRGFARFQGVRAKNDALDAKLIADCTAALGEARPAADPRLKAFSERLRLIEQVEDDIARLKTRKESFSEAAPIAFLDQEIARHKAWRKAALKALVAELRVQPDLAAKLDLIISIPGIAERTALALLIHMPELGSLSREQVAALAGLAPFDDDSAQRRGQRHIYGGRHRVRRSLYAAALPATFHWNPALKALYQRLRTAGKAHKLALVACARKLLIYANTVLARQAPWIPA